MAKRSKRDSHDRYVALSHWMLRTAAWRDLDCVARCAYIELSGRYRGPKSNNGRLPFSVREMAVALHVSKATASRAFDRLQDHGFIVEAKRGAFNCKVRHSTEWRLTEFGCDVTNALPTKDYARWEKQNTVSPQGPNGPSHETDRSLSRNPRIIEIASTVSPRGPRKQNTVSPEGHRIVYQVGERR